MTRYRALDGQGVEIGVLDIDPADTLEAIKWAASVGLRQVERIERQDGSEWTMIFKYDGVSSA